MTMLVCLPERFAGQLLDLREVALNFADEVARDAAADEIEALCKSEDKVLAAAACLVYEDVVARERAELEAIRASLPEKRPEVVARMRALADVVLTSEDEGERNRAARQIVDASEDKDDDVAWCALLMWHSIIDHYAAHGDKDAEGMLNGTFKPAELA